MKRLSIILLLLLAFQNAISQEFNLIPQPKSIKTTSQKWVKVKRINTTINSEMPSEGYYLSITKKGVEIEAADSTAIVWAHRTLKQLEREGLYPQVQISDHPDFQIRGFMHDTGRNFIEVEMLKEHLDILSYYKINAFHWHLTDYPAWRIECKVYPELNDPQFQRKGRDEGKFYTYDQIRDVIAYAKQRGIMVIPEIDMPGHSTYFNNTFGFSMDSEEGKKVLEKCLDEFFTEIPRELAPYFHIGSDEIYIADPEGFMCWAEAIVQKYDRQAIAWDPGLPSSTTTVRQIWNEAAGANSAAAEKEGFYLDSFMGYLNYYNPMVFTNRLLLHTPCAVDVPKEESLGGILCLWNDVNVEFPEKTFPHNGALNGILPYAERFWNGGRWGDDGEIVSANLLPAPTTQSGQKVADFEEKMIYHRDNYLKDRNMRWVANSQIEWTITIGTEQVKAYGGAIDMSELARVNDVEVTYPMVVTATTTIYADTDTTIRAWVGFDTPARSDKIGNGIGKQGEWEADGKVTVGGVEVKPPVAWNEPEKYNYQFHTWHKPEAELPFTDEHLYWMRTPAYIPLKRGENIVEVTTVKIFDGQFWSFAFIPLTLNDDNSVSEVTGVSFR